MEAETGEMGPQADGWCTLHKLEEAGRSCPELWENRSLAASSLQQVQAEANSAKPARQCGWGTAEREGPRTSVENCLLSVLSAQLR